LSGDDVATLAPDATGPSTPTTVLNRSATV